MAPILSYFLSSEDKLTGIEGKKEMRMRKGSCFLSHFSCLLPCVWEFDRDYGLRLVPANKKELELLD